MLLKIGSDSVIKLQLINFTAKLNFLKFKNAILGLLLLASMNAGAQLFDNKANTSLVKKTVDYIYNMQPNLANRYIDSVETRLPNHPVVSLMRAMNVLWQNVPNVTALGTFDIFSNHLYETIKRANRLDGGRQEAPEAIFFEITARGLLAEYYADAELYMKAMSEAGKAYNLMKSAMHLTDQNPDFFLPVGVYNYFREKYPERHPSFKALLWLFRSGDIELGISQLKDGCRYGVLTKVESYIYLSYIYLRYEEIPELAQRYLLELSRLYPNNHYVTAKYLESLVGGENYKKIDEQLIGKLLKVNSPYYQLAGYTFQGLYAEKILKNNELALKSYERSVTLEDKSKREPDYYMSLTWLGMSRISMANDQKESALRYAEKAIDRAETKEVTLEAKKILYRLQ